MTVKRTYVGEADRVYPSLGLEPVPGQEYSLDKDQIPDDGVNWLPRPQPRARTPRPPVTPTAKAGA